MAQINDRAPTWLLNHADPIHWAEFLFIGQRFGHLTSNIAESLNAWLLKARKKSILGSFEDYRNKLMDWFDVRRKLEVTTPGILVSKVANEMKGLALAIARRCRCITSTEMQFEVLSTVIRSEYRINIELKTCSCGVWQSTGIPCCHTISIILGLGKDPQLCAQEFYTLEFYRNTYINAIFHPLTHTGMDNRGDREEEEEEEEGGG